MTALKFFACLSVLCFAVGFWLGGLAFGLMVLVVWEGGLGNE